MPGTDSHEDGQQLLDQQQSPLQQQLFVNVPDDQLPAVRPDGVALPHTGQVGFWPKAPQELLGQLAQKETPFELSAIGLQQGTTAADFFSSKTHKVTLHTANMGNLEWTCCLEFLRRSCVLESMAHPSLAKCSNKDHPCLCSVNTVQLI